MQIEKEIRPKGTHPSLFTYTVSLEKENDAGELLEELFPKIHASSETDALNKAKKQHPDMTLYEVFERVPPWKPVAKKDFGKHEYRVWLSNKKGDVREWTGLAKTEEDAIAKATQSEGKGFGEITKTGISEFFPFGKFIGFENYDDEPPAGILYGTSNENFDDFFIRVKESTFEPFSEVDGQAYEATPPPISPPPNKSWWTKVKNVFSNPAEVDVDVIDEIVYGYGFPPGTSADHIMATLAKDGIYDPKDPQQAETVDDMVADYLSDVEDPYCVGCGKEIGENEECESVEGGLICLDCDELQENPSLDYDELEIQDRRPDIEFEDELYGRWDFEDFQDLQSPLPDREKFKNALRVTRIEEGDTAADIAEFAITNGILPPHLLEDYKEFVVKRKKNVRRTESRRRAAEKRASRSSTAPVEKIDSAPIASSADAHRASSHWYDRGNPSRENPGGVRNNPPIGHDDFLAQAKKHYKPAAKVGSKVSLRFDDGLELEPGEYLKIEPAENMELNQGAFSRALGDYAVSIKEPLVLANKGPSYVAGGTLVGAYKISSDTGEEVPTNFYHSGGYKSVIFVPNKDIILENPHGGVRNNPCDSRENPTSSRPFYETLQVRGVYLWVELSLLKEKVGAKTGRARLASQFLSKKRFYDIVNLAPSSKRTIKKVEEAQDNVKALLIGFLFLETVTMWPESVSDSELVNDVIRTCLPSTRNLTVDQSFYAIEEFYGLKGKALPYFMTNMEKAAESAESEGYWKNKETGEVLPPILFNGAGWATIAAVSVILMLQRDATAIEGHPMRYQLNPGGIHENPSERCETVGRAAQKTCETTVRASRAAMAGARGARDEWRRNPYPDVSRSGVISYNNAHPGGTPVASSTRSWDANAVRKKADARKMYHASTWVEPGKEEDKSAYKFPHHYTDGKNTLSPRGVAAAMAALMGARSERWGGPHFPGVSYDSARRGIYKHLAEHYRKDLGREPPSLESVGGRERLPERKRKRLNPHSGSQRPGHVADSLTNSQMDIMEGYNDRQMESDDPKVAYSWKELPKRVKDKILKIKHHRDTIRDADDYLSGLYDRTIADGLEWK